MPNVYVGSTPISKAELGTTDVTKIYLGSTLIWPTITKYSFTETFSTNASLDSYTGWSSPTNGGAFLVGNAGVCAISNSSTAGNWELFGHHSVQCNTDENEVSATIASRAPTNYDSEIYLHANSARTDRVALMPTTFSNVYGIHSVIGGVRTRRATISGWALNQNISLRATQTGAYFTYTAYRNGVSVGSWADTTNIMSHGNGNRYSGLMETFNRTGGFFPANNFSNAWDNWAIEDL